MSSTDIEVRKIIGELPTVPNSTIASPSANPKHGPMGMLVYDTDEDGSSWIQGTSVDPTALP